MATVHVVGAGLAGLSAAVTLAGAGREVIVYEAAAQAGGRCRSYFDSKLDCVIDNGNHLLFSSNRATLNYLDDIGAGDSLIGPKRARFAFVDLKSGERWNVSPGAARIPWWLFDSGRRIPGTGISDYGDALRLARADKDQTVAQCLAKRNHLWQRFWVPLTVAALNTQPEEASAVLLWRVLKDSFFKGEAACRPLIARDGLASSLVEPALDYLRNRAGSVQFNRRVRAVAGGSERVSGLQVGEESVGIAAGDQIILAASPGVAKDLLPDVTVPEETRPIVNAHIRLPAPPTLPDDLPMLGLIGGTAEWLFVRGPIVSLTVSAAQRLVDTAADQLAAQLWADTAKALDLDPGLDPPVRIIKERRATFAATPAMLARRPGPVTRWGNLFLAGDWTDTGYPATIESAVRSGQKAAGLALQAE